MNKDCPITSSIVIILQLWKDHKKKKAHLSVKLHSYIAG